MKSKTVFLIVVTLIAIAVVVSWLGTRLVSFDNTIHRTRLGDTEIRIEREPSQLGITSLYFTIFRDGKVLKRPTGLAPEVSGETFGSIVLADQGVIAVVENSRPHILIIGFDVNNGDMWPDRDLDAEEQRAAKERLLSKIALGTHQSYEFYSLSSSRAFDVREKRK